MRRLLLFIALAAVAVAAAVWVADRPGTISIVWEGWRLDTSVAILLVLTGAVALALALGLRTLGWLVRVPRRWRRWAHERRRRRGYQALTHGMVAVAAGDPEEATRQARRADVLLDEPPLTMLLSAQAAQLAGDEAAARRYFTAMLDRPETEFLGLRGLLMQAVRGGDDTAALDLARRARRLRPETPWVLTTLVDLEARAGDWRSAGAALDEAKRRRALPVATARRRAAAFLTERSRAAEDEGRSDEALDLASRAHDEDPAFVPAVARYVRLLGLAGRQRKAERTAERAWPAAPHPELAAAFRDLVSDGEPAAQLLRMQRLVAGLPDDPESHLAVAAAAAAAQSWSEARRHVEAAAAARPSARAWTLLAEIEEQEKGDVAAAQHYLRRAADAPPAEAWTCTACGSVAPAWSTLCPACGAVDTLDWRPPAAMPLATVPRAIG
ncbi:MAG: heme biosynthesis protein HemY [Alphaproteobacteria bacterium]